MSAGGIFLSFQLETLVLEDWAWWQHGLAAAGCFLATYAIHVMWPEKRGGASADAYTEAIKGTWGDAIAHPSHTEFLVHGIERGAYGVAVQGQANLPNGTGHGFSETLRMPDDQSYLPDGRTLRSLSDVEIVEAAWKKHVAAGYYDYL